MGWRTLLLRGIATIEPGGRAEVACNLSLCATSIVSAHRREVGRPIGAAMVCGWLSGPLKESGCVAPRPPRRSPGHGCPER